MSDHDERERATTASEGVRILGAQEAAALEAQRRAASEESEPDEAEGIVVSEDGPDVAGDESAPRAEPATAQQPAVKLWPDEGPSWSASEAVEPAAADASEPSDTDLPHWSEPATGQVPAVFAEPADEGAAEEGDDSDAWAAFTGSQPRYRSEDGDWADAGFLDSLAADDEVREGALAEPEPDVTEDDEAFVRAVRARRRSGTRQVVTSTPSTRPPGAAPSGGRPRRTPSRPGDMLPKPPGRDLTMAVWTAGIFAAIAIVCFVLGRAATSVLAAAVIGVAAVELCSVLHEKGLRPATFPVVAACAAMPIAAYHYSGTTAFPVILTLVTITSMLSYLWGVAPGRPVVGVATSLLVYAYVGGLGGYAGLLLQSRDGIGLLIGTVLCVVAYDVVGYFAGSQFGHSPIAPDVSPNKTVEGSLAGVAASIVMAVAVLGRFAPWHGAGLSVLLPAGLLLGVASLLGDLCESMLKRDLGIKDFGSFLPGHGGFLDRFDGLLFALPVAFYVAVHTNIF